MMSFLSFNIPVILQTSLRLALSTILMSFAWQARVKDLSAKPWYLAAFASWGIALFECLLQVPANRIGHTGLSLPQLKIMQDAITWRWSCLLRCSTCNSRSS